MKQLLRKTLAHAVSRLPRGILTDPAFFPLYERRGVHITPAHYYYPTPVLADLDDAVFETPSEMVGIDMRIDEQQALAERFANAGYFAAYREASKMRPAKPGQGFGGIDGRMLYAMIRDRKPSQIIEIGSGYSTLTMIRAVRQNGAGRITAIEPYENSWLEEEISDVGEVVRKRVEKVPLSTFEALGSDDILFIDSSHVARVGGDVVYEINEILPRLRPGVAVHVHDICFPYPYSRKWVIDEHKFWNEQFLLQAFLAFNSRVKVLWCFSYMQAYRQEVLKRLFPHYEPGKDMAGSFWMEICGS